MTDTIRYVDTDVSGGTGDGTSWANAYSSLAEWSAAEAGTVASGDRHIVNCRGVAEDTASAVLNLSADGWAGSGELHIVGDSPDYPVGWDASKYVWQAFGQSVPFRAGLSTLKLRLQNLQRKFDGNYPSAAMYVPDAASFGAIEMEHCVDDFRGCTTSNRRSIEVGGTGAATGSYTRTNHLVLGDVTRDLYCNYVTGGTFTTSQATIESCSDTLSTVNSTSTVDYDDCAIGGTFTAFTKQAPTFTNCATEAGIGTNPVTVTDWAAAFTDPANDDWSLLGSSQLLSAGSTGNNIGSDQTTQGAPAITNVDGDNVIEQGQTGVQINTSNFPASVTSLNQIVVGGTSDGTTITGGTAMNNIAWNGGNPTFDVPAGLTIGAGQDIHVDYTE